jgi:PAS domain S-box-containing protein
VREPADPASAPAPLAALDGDPRRFFEILDQIPAVLCVLRGPTHVVEFANPLYRALAGDTPLLGRPVAEVFDQPENRAFVELLDTIHATGEPVRGYAQRGVIRGREVFYDFVYLPLRSDTGEVEGVLVHAVEATAAVGARRAAEEAENRYRTLFDSNVVGVCVTDEERVLEANDAYLAIVGRTRGDLDAGRISWRDVTPPQWAAADERAIDDLRTRGRVEAFEKEYQRPDGTLVPVLIAGATIDRDPVRVIAFVVDLTERRAAEREREILLVREREARREAELAAGRMARLQRVTAALSAAMSAGEVAELVVDHARDALGASAAVVALTEGSELVVRGHSGYQPGMMADWNRFPLSAPVPLANAVRTGAILLLEDAEEVARRYPDVVRDGSHFEALAAVPLVFHGQALGAMGISFRQPRDFTAGDRGFLLALGRQCAQALERARLYEERSYVARTLQEGLLPDHLAEAPGLDIAVRYHSISDGGAVGGDFYDFFDVGENRWMLAVGDVCGKGTAAAVLTGLARHTIRAIAMREEGPAAVLEFLNEAMRRQISDSSYCTVGVATLTREPDGRFSTCMASGGHVFPLLLRRGEPLREIEVPGTLLGFVEDLRLESVPFDLQAGDTLVFYTDGVTDARGDGERFGEERLHATLEAARGGSAEAIAEAVDEAVRRHQPDRPKDDRAVVVLQVHGG